MPTANEIAYPGTGISSTSSVVAANNKVGFKVGPQSAVNRIINAGTGATPGYFYLTDVEHRLYVANNDGSLSPINEGVTVVSSISDLPSFSSGSAEWKPLQGRFYYVENSNILCVCSNEHWVQINPDTYLINNENAVTGASASLGNGINKVTVTTTVQDTNAYGSQAASPVHTVRGNFAIAGSKNVGVSWDDTTRTITLTGNDSGVYGFGTATRVQDGETIARLVLTEYSDDTKTTVVATTPIDLLAGSHVTPTVVNSGSGIKFEGGGLDGATLSITQPVENGALQIILAQPGLNGDVRTSIAPKIQITGTSGTETIPFVLSGSDLTASLNVYSSAKVDELISQGLREFDSMYFAGLIGDVTGATSSTLAYLTGHLADLNVKSGATFKVAEDHLIVPSGMTIEGFDKDNDLLEIGDLIIVTGTENSNGIVSSNIKYTYVPSGNDIDKYWTPSRTTNGMLWTPSVSTDVPQRLDFVAASNSQVTVTPSNSVDGTTQVKTVTIGHKNMGSAAVPSTPTHTTTAGPTTSDSAGDYTAITGLTLENGHVTGIETTKITLYTNKLKSVTSTAAAVSGATNTIKLTTDYVHQHGDVRPSAVNNWQLSSDTLTLSVNAAGSTSGTVTAADIHLDMVWGSFS